MTTLYQGHVVDCLRSMPDSNVHCGVTSPPYWGLRNYRTNPVQWGDGWAGCLGAEPTPEMFVAHLVEVFGEFRRVLRDDGVLFVNLGDTYIGSGKGGNPGEGWKQNTNLGSQTVRGQINSVKGIADLNKSVIPHRFALAMQADGWYFRDDIIWHKPAPMPSSVSGWRWERHRIKVKSQHRSSRGGKEMMDNPRLAQPSDLLNQPHCEWADCPGCKKCDPTGGYILKRGSWRTTCAHEHILMFAKSDTYFCDSEAVKEPAATATIQRNQYSRIIDDPDEQYAVAHDHEFEGSTRNPRSVWIIGPDPFRGSHYAVFPRELPRRCIEAATSAKGCCPKCGSQWARIVDRTPMVIDRSDWGDGAGNRTAPSGTMVSPPESSTTGWRATCKCGDSLAPIPCTIADIFGGSGTTAEVGVSMNRRAILCELNQEYVELSRKRLLDAVPLMSIGAA